jgi:hypothetical protein
VEIILSKQAEVHIAYWKGINNVAVQKRIISFKNAIIASPYIESGKTEPFKYELEVNGQDVLTKKPIYLFCRK